MRVTDEQLDRLWRIRETLTDFADIAALELAISALSHAAGQDAVAPDEVYIREAAGTYTLCDLQETTFDDAPLYCARKASALTPAQPDEPVAVEIWPKTVVVSSGDMCFTADWDGEYFVTRSPIKLDDAAIAAQRKEGE